jgi:hypothetical protein
MSMKNSSDTIENRTRDLSVCSEVKLKYTVANMLTAACSDAIAEGTF